MAEKGGGKMKKFNQMTYKEKMDLLKSATNGEKEALTKLAIGRILKLGSRPTQEGDIKQYEECKFIIMTLNALDKDFISINHNMGY